MLNESRQEQILTEVKHVLNRIDLRNYETSCQLQELLNKHVPNIGAVLGGDNQPPHIRYSAAIKQDGDQYCCMIGGDLMSGIAAFGTTPEKACKQFDKVWREGDIPKKEE